MAQTPTELVSGGLTSIGEMTEFKNELYFSARGRETPASPLSGSELWKIEAGGNLTLVKDIAEGPSNAIPRELTVLGDNLFFTARNTEFGMELWRTDGTRDGTVPVRDIAPGIADSSISQLTVVGSSLYFVADNGVHGMELWKSDGTTRGTFMVEDLVAGSGSPMISELTAVGDVLFFAANEVGGSGKELWKSDGTPGGSTQVADINPLGSSNPASLTPWNDRIYFGATTLAEGREVWSSDGTANGTQIVADIFAGSGSGLVNNPQFAATNNQLIFAADSSALGVEPWVVDTTGAAQNLMDIHPGAADSGPDILGAFGDQVLFSGISPSGTSSYLASDSFAGAVQFESHLGVSLDEVLFIGDAGLVFTSDDAYWQTDAQLGNTELLAEPNEGVGFSNLLSSTLIFQSGNRILSFEVNLGAPAVDAAEQTIAEGSSLTLSATSSTPDVIFSWDIDGDGEFTDASGASPTLAWSELNGLGITDDGQFTVAVQGTSTEGTSSVVSTTVTVTNVAPELISFSGPLFAKVDNSVSFVASAVDAAGDADPLTFNWDFGDGQAASGAAQQHAFVTPGTFTVTLTISDDDGASTVHTQQVTVQLAAPDADAGGPYAIDEGGGEVQLDASASTDPNGADLTFEWDLNADGVFGDASGSTPTVSWADLNSFGIDNDGDFPIRVRVSDPQAISAEAVATLSVQNLPPTIQDFSAQDFGRAGTVFSFSASATDVNDEITYSWDFGDGSDVAVGADVSHVYSVPGTFTATLAVSDGTDEVLRTQEVNVDAVVPTASAGGPYEIAEGDALSLDGTASSDPNGDVLTIEWDLNNDGDFSDATGESPTVPWDRLAVLNPPVRDDGEYVVSVRATDPDGNASQSTTTLTITNSPPRLVAVSVPTIANPGVELRFSAAGEDFAGVDDPLTYEWDFGDGTSRVIGQRVTHTFRQNGEFNVTATIRDDDGGEVTAVRPIEVTSNFSPPNIDTGGPYVITEGEELVLDPTNTVDPLNRGLIFLWDLNEDGITDVSSFGALTVSWNDLTTLQGSVADDGIRSIELLAASLFEPDVVSAQTTLTILNAAPTIVSVAHPATTSAGQQVAFSAVAEDPNPNDQLNYRWNFGDGTTGTGASVAKVYQTTGTFEVTLRVDDGDGGLATETASIMVETQSTQAVEDSLEILANVAVSQPLQLLANDLASGQGVLQVVEVNQSTDSPASGTYGMLNWDSSGEVTYVLDAGNEVVQALPGDGSLIDEFSYMAMDDGGESTSRLLVRISGVPDAVAPTVVSAMRDDPLRYDVLNSYSVQFSEDVSGSLTASDLQLVDVASDQVIDSSSATVAWDAETNTAVWDLSQVSIPQGAYRVTLAETIQDPAGNALDGDGDGQSGGAFAVEETLTWQGDANLDLQVDFTDFDILVAHFGLGSDWLMADFNVSGTTDIEDFILLLNNFGNRVDATAAAFADEAFLSDA